MENTISPAGSGPLTSTVCPECGTWIAPKTSHCTACGHSPDGAPMKQSLPSLASGSNSLAQSARLKQLNIAQRILFTVGILTILINLAQFGAIEAAVEQSMNAQAQKVIAQGKRIDPVKFAQIKKSAVQIGQLTAGGFVGIGVLYVVFGLILHRFPVPVTIVALSVYVGLTVIMLMIDPAHTAGRVIFRVIIIVALVKAVQAAIAYQRQRNSAGGMEAGFSV